ncbi:hypothetical protein [Paraclostridium bifermentans]|uniref:hypothetical protein n=1 Tax=Paraclostridium bifermentans TaxID=1490 RepID=UPI0025B03CF4|nr:hypothetical protein [Paraclostridium bifermentans]
MIFNDTNILIRKSDEDFIEFNLDSGIKYKIIKKNLQEIHSEEFIDGNFSFVDMYIDVDNEDNVYGILNDKLGKICSLSVEDKIKLNTIFKYDYKNFYIKFPYIKKILKEKHLIYYSINKENPLMCTLIHMYMHEDKVIKNNIDYIPYNIMSNFEVVWKDNTPTVFYLKSIKGNEELFISTYNNENFTWSNPLKVTESKESKIYLSALIDKHNNYHVVFAENNKGKYYCKYIKLRLFNDKFDILSLQTIKTNTMCLFPHLINYEDIIKIQWGEYNCVYECKSIDLGNTWSDIEIYENESSFMLRRYIYKSNHEEDKLYKFSTIFTDSENVKNGNYRIQYSI